MKKRFCIFLLAALLLLPLCACGNRSSVGVIGGADGPMAVLVSGGLKSLFRTGNVKHAVTEPVSSERYTEDDIASAIRTAKDYFHDHFGGCTLTEISYAGDERNAGEAENASKYGMEEIIVLISAFDVDGSGGDGSLNPNSHYEGWLWILGRRDGGGWAHLDHGY